MKIATDERNTDECVALSSYKFLEFPSEGESHETGT